MFTFDLSRAALLVIDMQNDFGAATGMFDAAGVDLAPIRAVVPSIAAVLGAVRAAGLPVVFIKMGFLPDLSDAGPAMGPNRIKHRPMRAGEPSASGHGRVLVRGDWGTQIIAELAPRPGEHEVWKSRFSGFFGTDLDELLKAQGIDSLLVTGCTTSVCVDATVRDAMYRDYRCLIVEDCVAEPIAHDAPRSNHEASLLTIQSLFGWVSTSEEFVKAFAPPPSAAAAK